MIALILLGAGMMLLGVLLSASSGKRVSAKKLREYQDAERFANMAVHKIKRGELVSSDGKPIKGAKP